MPLPQIPELSESDQKSPIANISQTISFLDNKTEDTTFFNTNRLSEQVETIANWRLEWTKRLDNPIYNGGLCTLNLFIIVFSFYKDHSYEYSRLELQKYWKFSTVIVNCFFLTDLIANIAVMRFLAMCKKKKHLLLEIILQAACIAVYYKLFGNYQLKEFSNAVGIAMTIYFVRLIRVVEFFSEL